MKIRTAIMYALVILLLTGLTATAWYYWLTEGGSALLPVFVSLLSLCLAVYGLFKTSWRPEQDVKQLQRQQQRRELRRYLHQTRRRLRRSGGAPRWDRRRISTYWLLCDDLPQAQAFMRQHGFTPLAEEQVPFCYQAGNTVIRISTPAWLTGDGGQESARHLVRLNPSQPLHGFILLSPAPALAALSDEQVIQSGRQHHEACIAFSVLLGCRPPMHLMFPGLGSVPALRRGFADPQRAQFCHSTDFSRERKTLPDAPFAQFTADLILSLQREQFTALTDGQPEQNAAVLSFPAQLETHLNRQTQYVAALQHQHTAGTHLVLSSALLCAAECGELHIATPLFERVIHGRDEVICQGRERRRLTGYCLAVSVCLAGTAAAGVMQWHHFQVQQENLSEHLEYLSRIAPAPAGERVHHLHLLQPVVTELRREYEQRWFSSPLLPLYRDYQQQIRSVLFPLLAAEREQRLQQAVISSSPQLLQITGDYRQLFADDHQGTDISDADSGDDILSLLDDYPVQPLTIGERRLYNAALVAQAQQKVAASDPAQWIYPVLREQFLREHGTVPLNALFPADITPLFQPEHRFLSVPYNMTKAGYTAWQAQWEDPDFQSRFTDLLQQWTENTLVAPESIIAQISRQYDEEYIRYWQQFLSSLAPRHTGSPEALITALRLTEQPFSDPVTALVQGISRNTTFAAVKPGAAPDLKSGQQTASLLGMSKLSSKLRKAGRLQSAFSQYKKTDEQAGGNISRAFSAWHVLLTPEGMPSPALAALQQSSVSLRQYWEQGMAGDDPQAWGYQQIMKSAEPPEAGPGNVPPVLETLLRQWQQTSAQLQSGLAAHYLDRQWQTTVYPFWRDRLAPYYPFSHNAQGVKPDDLHAFLTPGGVMDTFMQLLPPDHRTNPLYAALKQPEAQTGLLRQLFYADASAALNVRISLRPVALTPQLSGIRLAQGNDSLLYQHGPSLWQDFYWPPAADAEPLTADYFRHGKVVYSASYPGEWGLLRWLLTAQSQGLAASPESVVSENGYVFRFRSRINGRAASSAAGLFADYHLPPSLFSSGNSAENPQNPADR
ncbi:ImcF-related family protein [Morganella morganii subsp. sibonii]